MPNRYDAIVIGSGFGGAVTACRLAQKGHKVLILERGRRWDRSNFPRSRWDWKTLFWCQDKPDRYNGWLDFRIFRRMCVAQGSGVGGGSLIYANVVIDAKPEVFHSGWPAEITFVALEPYYAKVTDILNPHPLPTNQLTERFKLAREAARKLGHEARFRALPLAVTFDASWHEGLLDPHSSRHSRTWTNAQGQVQGTCVHCGNCVIGCPVGARNTLDLNYLPLAQQRGTEIRDLHLVRCIEPSAGGYRVYFDRIDRINRRLIPGSETADRVILAAGSLGSTELLLRCRGEYKTLPNLSQFLGYNWSPNGDLLTPTFYWGKKVSPTRGPTITAAIDFLDGNGYGEQSYVEDGGFPEAIFGKWTPLMPWFGQGVDAGDGRLSLRRSCLNLRKSKLKVEWDSRRSKPLFESLARMHKELSKVTGGLPIPSTWALFRTILTPHPLGGCGMGTTPANGVVDHRGEVFSYPRLYVADGAIIPKAIGLNPSKTIAALAERIADLI